MLSKPHPTPAQPKGQSFVSCRAFQAYTSWNAFLSSRIHPPIKQLFLCPSSLARSRMDAGIGLSFHFGHRTLSSCQLSTSTTFPHPSQENNITSRSDPCASFEQSHRNRAPRLWPRVWPMSLHRLSHLSAARTAGLYLWVNSCSSLWLKVSKNPLSTELSRLLKGGITRM